MKRLLTPAAGALAAVFAIPSWSETTTEEEITVVASRLPVEMHKVGHSLTVLDRQRVSDIGYAYGADLFRFVPGVSVSRTGGYSGNTQLRLRGAEGNHVLVLVDGIDVSAAGTGEFDFSSLLSADIERIEVLRGPQSGLYGSNALAGVISIQTLRPEAGVQLNGSVEAGSDDARQGGVSVAGGSDRIRGRLSYTVRRTQFDVSGDDAFGAEDDEDDNRTLSGQLIIDATEQLTFSILGRYTQRETDLDGFDFSGGPQQGLAIDNASESETDDLTLAANATLQLSEGRSVTRIGFERTDTESDGGTFGNEASRDQFKLDSSWRWDDQLKQQTTLFLQNERETFRNTYPFDPSQVPEQDRTLFGVGVEHRMALDEQLFVTATIRHDENDDFEDVTTWSVDASYLLPATDTRLHASYGKGVTNPTFFEQFGFTPGTFVGNPNLEPEASTGWDFGAEQSFFNGALQVDLTYFDADLENEIQSVFPSAENAAGESNRKGVELSIAFNPSSSTSIYGTYTYTDADEPAGQEVRRPEHTASLNLAQSLFDGRARIALNVIYNGEVLDNDFRNFFTNGFMAERTELDSYTLVNINASYQITDQLQAYVRAENVFDEAYQEVIGYATPGAAVFAGLRFRLSP